MKVKKKVFVKTTKLLGTVRNGILEKVFFTEELTIFKKALVRENDLTVGTL